MKRNKYNEEVENLYELINDVIFDEKFYLKSNPDVLAAKVDPLTHYVKFGWKEGRMPSDNSNRHHARQEEVSKTKTIDEIINAIPISAIGKYAKKQLFKYGFQVEHPAIKGITIPTRLQQDIFETNGNALERVFSRLQDNDSRRCYACLIAAAISGNPRFYFHAQSSYKQYFHPYVKAKEGDVILDVGAFDGVTAVDFLADLDGAATVVSLEPSSKNYAYMLSNIENYSHKDKIIPINMGSWNKKDHLQISDTAVNPGITFLDANCSDVVEVIDIDALVNDYKLEKVSLIKMDVEGAELESLKGSVEVIKKYKPKLSISIYHKPEDYWEISDFIESLELGYKQYIGHHYFGFWETVLYAVIE